MCNWINVVYALWLSVESLQFSDPRWAQELSPQSRWSPFVCTLVPRLVVKVKEKVEQMHVQLKNHYYKHFDYQCQ